MAFNIKYTFDLIDKLTPVSKKIEKSLKSLQNSIRKISTKINNSFKKIGKGIDQVGKKAKQVGKSLFIGLTLPITALGVSFIKAASDAQETSSKFATVFQDVGIEAERTANTIAKSFGLSAIKTKELLGDTGDLLTGFGFTGKAALDLAKQTNELAVDLASFTNFSGGAEGASKALTKALLGERESVKSLGISILEKDVKTKVSTLIAQGFRFESMRQAKAVATLKIAIEQSKNAIGDYARTNKDFANRTRVLSARFHDFRILLGNILLPIALKLVNITIKLINKFNALSPTTKKIILIVSGLVAVLAPLLLLIGIIIPAIGFMSTAIIALATGFKILTAVILLNPIGLIVTGIIALITLVFIVRKKLKDLGFTLSDIPRLALDSFQRNFPKIFAFFDFLLEKAQAIFGFIKKGIELISKGFSKGKELLGFKAGDVNLGNKEINQTINPNINQRQSVDINTGGLLDIRMKGAPPRTSANYTPFNSNMGPSSAYQGG